MTNLAVVLVLSAAIIHASWNFLAKKAGGGPEFIWLFSVIAGIIYAPIAIGILVIQKPLIGWIGIIFILVSALLHLFYYLVLQKGYSQGDLSLVYPLARGTGPLLSTLAAIVILHERPSVLGACGAAFVIYSVFHLTGGFRLFGKKNPQTGWAVRYGILTGVIIAGYTVWDKQAVSRFLIPPVLLDWSFSLGRTLFLFHYAIRRWDEVKHQWKINKRYAIGVAVLNPLSYIFILTAMIFTPVSYVAPAREISILFGTLMGAKILAEEDARRRIIGACIMIAGVIALSFG